MCIEILIEFLKSGAVTYSNFKQFRDGLEEN